MKGERFTGKIRDLSVKGHGVVDHPNGLVFFVAGTWPGDEAELEIVSVEKRYGFAKLLKLINPSKDRVPSPCPHLGWEPGQCGGCPWMIGSYSTQLQFKQKFLDYQIKRASLKYTDFIVHPIWGSEKILGYRNRAQLKTDGTQYGFVSSQLREIAPIDDCLVLSDKNRQTLKTIKQNLPLEKWKPTGNYTWSFFDIDEAITFDDIELNKRRPFMQGNSQQNERMKEWLLERLANENPGQSVVELFCGSGNFTEIIAKCDFKEIVAAEVSTEAIAALNAKNLPNVRTVILNMESQKSFRVVKSQLESPDIVVLDPPRTGFEDLRAFLKEFPSIKTIIYISCNVLTYLRDIKKIESEGWKIKEIQPLDQFPHTTHTELLSVIRK